MKLVSAEHPVLTQRADEVPKNEDVSELVRNMRRLMLEGKGIGLAANQVGELKRVITLSVNGFNKTIINPVITKAYGGKHGAKEGCLSFPGMQVMVVRDKQVVVEGYDEHWKPQKYKLRGLAARCIQHEIDHLDGITLRGTDSCEVLP